MPVVALVIVMYEKLRGHEILMADLDVTKNTWHQVARKKVMLDHT